MFRVAKLWFLGVLSYIEVPILADFRMSVKSRDTLLFQIVLLQDLKVSEFSIFLDNMQAIDHELSIKNPTAKNIKIILYNFSSTRPQNHFHSYQKYKK